MTDAKRHSVIRALIRDYTAASAGDKATARKTLIDEGIYTQKGELRVAYGGAGSKKAKNAA